MEKELGNHICLFYSNPDYQIRTIAKYFADSLNHGRKCVYIHAPNKSPLKQLKKFIPTQEIEFFLLNEVYLENDKIFNPIKAQNFWKKLYEKYPKLTVASDGTHLLNNPNNFKMLQNYEYVMQEKIKYMDIIAICQYQVTPNTLKYLKKLRNSHMEINGDNLSFLHLSHAILTDVEQNICFV